MDVVGSMSRERARKRKRTRVQNHLPWRYSLESMAPIRVSNFLPAPSAMLSAIEKDARLNWPTSSPLSRGRRSRISTVVITNSCAVR
jgi:hypothetical protein